MNLPTLKNLSRENRRLKRELVHAKLMLAATRHLIACKNPREHLALASRLETAEALLGEMVGDEPHAASLEMEA